MKKLMLPALLTVTLLATACSTLHLTVRNERSTPVKDVAVMMGNLSYTIPSLDPGAEDKKEVKVPADSGLRVNFSSDNGGLYYTASIVKLKKGDGRQLLLKLNEKGDLETEVVK